MTNSLDMAQILELAKAELAKRTTGQDFLLGDVYNITRQAYNKYREDPVIRQFAYVIERMAEKQGTTAVINQSDLTKIYNDLVRTADNTKFRDALGMFLLNSFDATSTTSEEYIRMNRVDADNTKLSTDEYIDQGLVNSLTKAFGGSIESERAYDEKAAKVGKEYVELELQAMGYKKPRVEIMGGDATTLVYAAHIDTEKGIVSVAIPIELSSNKLLLPSTFVADDHLEELTAQKFQYFVDKKAFNGNFSVPNVNSVITAVKMLTGLQKTASSNDFDSLLESFTPARFEERGDTISLSAPELFSERQEVQLKPEIDTTQIVEMPAELAHLAHDFENDILEAVSEYGKEAVVAGKQIVLSELMAAGFKNSQVRFGSESGDSVIYLAAIHTPRGPAEIEVPIEMKTMGNAYIPLAPTIFAYDGLIEDFTADKLQRFAIARATPSSGETVYSTAHSYMTLPDLRDELVKAATYGDYVTAEMILGTVQDRFDEDTYRNVIADYHYILMHNQRMAHAEEKHCTLMIAAGKGSIEPRCGHFGVPLSKVVVGEDGQCRLRSHIEKDRLNPLEETGAAISTSKLFLS